MNNIIEFLTAYGLTLSDVIQAILALLTLLTSIVAIFVSIKSIKLTKDSIYEANKPVIAVYLDYIQVYGNIHEYLVIKNFGKTQAIITNINFDNKIAITHQDKTPLLEEYGLPFSLAPDQSFSTILRNNAHNYEENTEKHGSYNEYFNKIEVEVTYKDTVKTFKEIFVLNQDLSKNIRLSKANGSKNTSPVKAALHIAEEMLRREV